MIAVDTNLVIRYMTGDQPEQAARARRIIDENPVFVAVTVVMEVAWVLRATFHLSRTEIVNALRVFAGMPTVTIEDDGLVAASLELAAGGIDFADALHLLKAQHCDEFATFDRKLLKAAAAAGYRFVREA